MSQRLLLLVAMSVCFLTDEFVLFPSTGFAETCLSGECHSEIKEKKMLHGPVGSDECTSCHEASDEELELHTKGNDSFAGFSFPEEKPICAMCHEGYAEGKVVHDPVSSGECIACHDPHGGDNKYFLVNSEEKELCFNCHDDDKTVKEFVHGPVAEGTCLPCHKPHSSEYASLLIDEESKLCQSCHDDKAEDLEKPVVHEPIKESCVSCHNPHNADAPFMLIEKNLADLCFSCHDDIHPELKESISKAKANHAPVKAGECVKCHLPHAGNFEKLLTLEGNALCLGCHDQLKKRLESSENIHAALEDGGCVGCHDAHGGKFRKLLKSNFSKKFYNKYKPGLYQLCFECHEKNLLEKDIYGLESATNFRDGEKNLHYVHVAKSKKGRNCIACHDVHEASQPKNIKEKVTFINKKWAIKIKYTPTDTGGTCVVGCHKPKTYNR